MKKKKLIHEKPDISLKGLRVRCSHCNTWVATCGETGAELRTCPHKEQLSYLAVVHIPKTKHGRVVRDLGNDLDTAIVKLAQLRADVKSGKVTGKEGKRARPTPPTQLPEVHVVQTVTNYPQSMTLVNAMAKYMAFLNNVNVPKHKQRDRSIGYKNDIARAFKYFCASLKEAGRDIPQYPLASISDDDVGIFCEYLERKDCSASTYNRYMSYFTSFLDWCAGNNYPVKNVFTEVVRQETETDSRSIPQEQYEQLLKLITYENGFQKYPGSKKETRNVFREYLTLGYQIGLLTGRRTEECIALRFSDIANDIKTISVEDFKPNRIRNRKGKQRKFIHIPITPQLRSLIDGLGYEQHKGTDRYLLAPEITENRVKAISDALSRSFSHYHKQLNTNDTLTWKCLRKTYLTKLKIFLQKNASRISVKDISNHSDDAVLEKHYFDQRLIAAALADSGFEVFPSRELELAQTRKQTQAKTPEQNQEL